MASGGTMSFPTLSDEEIINLCKEVVGAEIPITEVTLRNPTMGMCRLMPPHPPMAKVDS